MKVRNLSLISLLSLIQGHKTLNHLYICSFICSLFILNSVQISSWSLSEKQFSSYWHPAYDSSYYLFICFWNWILFNFEAGNHDLSLKLIMNFRYWLIFFSSSLRQWCWTIIFAIIHNIANFILFQHYFSVSENGWYYIVLSCYSLWSYVWHYHNFTMFFLVSS